jgi:hypothetical protein
MHIEVGPEFQRQRRRFDLRFCCEDCTFLDRVHDRCVHGWPDREHRRAHYEGLERGEVVFCKEFELL